MRHRPATPWPPSSHRSDPWRRGLQGALLSTLLALPWLLKFLWAPWVDHHGARRTWLLGLQGGFELVATACTASTNAIGIGFDLIQNDKNPVAVIVGSDPVLAKLRMRARGFRPCLSA